MMVLAVTLHNIPEGMAVGVIYAGFLSWKYADYSGKCICVITWYCDSELSGRSDYLLPLRAEGEKKSKAFFGGVLSGVVEPIGAVLTLAAAQLILPALPYLLSFAAGAMLYVVIEEMIPEMSQGKHLNIGTLFLLWDSAL